jgi:hypothetical protein
MDMAVPNGFGELSEPVRRIRRTCSAHCHHHVKNVEHRNDELT